jgi:hypothetical protein
MKGNLTTNIFFCQIHFQARNMPDDLIALTLLIGGGGPRIESKANYPYNYVPVVSMTFPVPSDDIYTSNSYL